MYWLRTATAASPVGFASVEPLSSAERGAAIMVSRAARVRAVRSRVVLNAVCFMGFSSLKLVVFAGPIDQQTCQRRRAGKIF
jgi:hypothetical protein